METIRHSPSRPHIPSADRLARKDPQCAHEILRALEAGGQLDDPLSQAVAQEHPTSRQLAMEEPDSLSGSPLIASRGDRCSDGYVVSMTGETVRPERDDHIGIDLTEQVRYDPDQDPTVDIGEAAIEIVEASRLGEPEFDSGRLEFLLPY